jgi:hypothetical protein
MDIRCRVALHSHNVKASHTQQTARCSLLRMSPYRVVKDQTYNSASGRHHNAVQIQPRNTDVAKKMEDPSAYDCAYHA